MSTGLRPLRSALRPWWYVAPVVLVLGGLFLVPLGLVLAQSLGYQAVGSAGAGSSLTLRYWQQALSDPEFLAALGLSLRVALVSTLIAVPAGLGLALALAALAPRSQLLQLCARMPLVVPHLVAGYLLLLLLGRTGLPARLAYHLGLITVPEQVPVLVYDAFGWGIILAYVWKEVPFVALLVYPLLGGGLAAWHEAARTLGATPLQALRHVVLPLTRPALAAATAIIFAYSFGAFELPLLLGRTFPRALPVLAYQRYTAPDLSLRPQAMVVALMLALVALAAAAWYLVSVRRLEGVLASVRRDAHG